MAVGQNTIPQIPTVQTNLDPTTILYGVTNSAGFLDTQLTALTLLNYPTKTPTQKQVVNVYDTVNPVGASYDAIIVNDNSVHTNQECYGSFIQFHPSGGTDGTVPGSNYGLGISAIKQNWNGGTTVQGQVCGMNIVNRSGYTGPTVSPNFSPGDSTGIIVNTVQASTACYTSILEGFSAYYLGGNPGASDAQAIRVQLAPIRKDQGIAIGAVVIGSQGTLGSAYQAQNATGSTFASLLQYVNPTGVITYDTPISGYVPRIQLYDGVGGRKTLRVASNAFDILNAAETVELFHIDDSGNALIQGNAGVVGQLQVTGTSTLAGATATTVPLTDNSQNVATTAFVKGQTLGGFSATTSAQLASIISDETGSGSLVFGTAPTLSQPNVVGVTTNSNAAAGSVGEFVTATGTAVSVSSGIGANITSISLTAGDWDVSGVIEWIPAGTTVIASEFAGISTTSGALGGTGTRAAIQITHAAGLGDDLVTPIVRQSLTTTTTVFLVANQSFSVSTCTANGVIRARRIR